MSIREEFVPRRESEVNARAGAADWQELSRIGLGALGPLVLLPAFVLVTLVLFFRRRLYQKTSRSAGIAAFCATLAVFGFALQHEARADEFTWLTASAGAVAVFLIGIFMLTTAEDYLWRRARSRVVAWFVFVRRPAEARAAGLGILRGCAIGFLFLAAHSLLMNALGAAALAGPSTLWLEVVAQSGRPYVTLYALSYAVVVTTSRAWVLFGFPAALAAGVTRRPAAMVAVPAALTALMALTLPGTTPTAPWALLVFAVFQGVFLALVFYRYDLLTLALTIFTIEVWLLVYPAWTVFSAVEATAWPAMIPWFVAAGAGAAIYLRPQIQAARRQIAAVFE